MIVVVGVRLPDVPVIVTVAGPVVAERFAVNVKVLVVALVEVKAAVTPLGRPAADKVTLPPKPPVGVIVIVLVLLLPCATLKVLGAADSVKPVETGPASVMASTTTLRLLGKLRLCTILFVFRGKE
jgi:hypothetical protein